MIDPMTEECIFPTNEDILPQNYNTAFNIRTPNQHVNPHQILRLHSDFFDWPHCVIVSMETHLRTLCRYFFFLFVTHYVER